MEVYTRERAPDGPITDECPICGAKYEWDACDDFYKGAVEKILDSHLVDHLAGFVDHDVTLYTCSNVIDDSQPVCGAVFAVAVTDRHGQRVFTPSTKEL